MTLRRSIQSRQQESINNASVFILHHVVWYPLSMRTPRIQVVIPAELLEATRVMLNLPTGTDNGVLIRRALSVLTNTPTPIVKRGGSRKKGIEMHSK